VSMLSLRRSPDTPSLELVRILLRQLHFERAMPASTSNRSLENDRSCVSFDAQRDGGGS
jgi:hypothetical protein